MTTWTQTDQPPDGWRDLCLSRGCVFHSPDWMRLLENSFDCQSMYVVDGGLERGTAISLFRAGPFRVGYLGFPGGGIVGADSYPADFAALLRQAIVASRPACVRIPVSAFGAPVRLDLPYDATPETAIVDLQSWSLQGITKNRRRDVRKSQRSGLDVVDAKNPADGTTLYNLYKGTIERRSGSLRYTESYFTELIRLAQQHSEIRILLAKLDGAIAAFTVVVAHHGVGYYLHGAFDWETREHIPAALLLNEAIEWAQVRGCDVFNLMSSPPGQESLVRYKEHWGAETREHRTYTLPLGWVYQPFKMAEKIYQLLR